MKTGKTRRQPELTVNLGMIFILAFDKIFWIYFLNFLDAYKLFLTKIYLKIYIKHV